MMGMDLFFGPSVERGPRRRRIYLTFDDGPNERATDAILETLALWLEIMCGVVRSSRAAQPRAT